MKETLVYNEPASDYDPISHSKGKAYWFMVPLQGEHPKHWIFRLPIHVDGMSIFTIES
jgi:hypothetical protein